MMQRLNTCGKEDRTMRTDGRDVGELRRYKLISVKQILGKRGHVKRIKSVYIYVELEDNGSCELGMKVMKE